MLDDILDIYKEGHRINDNKTDHLIKDGLIKALYEGRSYEAKELAPIANIFDKAQDDIVCKGRLSAAVDRAATYLEINELLKGKNDRQLAQLADDIAKVKCGQYCSDSDAYKLANLGDALEGGQASNNIIDAVLEDDSKKFQMFGSGLNKEELEQRNAFEERLNAMRAMPNFSKLLALMGEAVSFAHDLKKQKMKQDQGAITGLTFGNDIANIIPDEYISYICPQLKSMFLLDYMNENLLQDKIESKQPAGKGDIFIQLDVSSSMKWKFDGSLTDGADSRFYACVSLIFALMVELKKDKRRVVLATFNDHSRIVFDSAIDDNLDCFNNLLKVVRYGCHGGTYFNEAWQRYINYSKSSGAKLDFLFVTDGEDKVFDYKIFENDIKKMEAKVVTMVIRSSTDATLSDPLEAASDTVRYVKSFDDLKEMVDLTI